MNGDQTPNAPKITVTDGMLRAWVATVRLPLMPLTALWTN